MPNKIEVSFNSPQCGWMSIGFDDGVSEFHTTTAHAPHEKALPELLQILSQLLDKNSAQNEYLLKWNRDPEEFDFVFVKNGDQISLEIVQYPTDERATNEKETVFSYTGDVHELAQAFHATFTQLYEDRNIDEFEFNWRQSFPYEEFAKFESVLKTIQA